jgi:hypothetical protein
MAKPNFQSTAASMRSANVLFAELVAHFIAASFGRDQLKRKLSGGA